MIRKLLLLVLLLGACRDKPRTDSAPAPNAGAKGTGPSTQPELGSAADDHAGVPGSKNLAGLSQLMPMLQQEKANRPNVKVPVEKVFTALKDVGVDTSGAKQVLGKTAGAAYCENLKITPGGVTVGIVVCEYATAEAAEASRALLEKKWPIAGAVRIANGATLMTIVNAGSQKELQSRVIDTFKSL